MSNPVVVQCTSGQSTGDTTYVLGSTVYHLSGAITSFTLTPTVGAIDRLEWLSPDGAGWALLAINQGATF